MDLREAIAIIAGSMDESSLTIEDYYRYGFTGKPDWSDVKAVAQQVLYQTIRDLQKENSGYRNDGGYWNHVS